MTIVGREDRVCASHHVKNLPEADRCTTIHRLESEEQLLQSLITAAAMGACCVWIRNTVDQAIDTTRRLRALGHDVDLFHARFAMGDRLSIEANVLRRYGKRATAEERRGKILIATQVVEQSLDLDFDWMASDLAPIDLLIQRIGRLWRHIEVRPASSRPLTECALQLLSPDPDEVLDERWAKSVLGGGAWVYDVGTLWRTARALVDAGSIHSPHALPELLEQVAGEDPLPLPEPILREAGNAEGERFAARAIGAGNVVKIDDGYGGMPSVSKETKYPTRLGEPSVEIVLARNSAGGALNPWADDDFGGIAASTVSVSRRRYEKLEALATAQTDEAISVFTADWPEWQRASRVVAEVREGGAIVDGLRYDTAFGLQFVEAESV